MLQAGTCTVWWLCSCGTWGMAVHHGMAPGTCLLSPGLCHLPQASLDVGSLVVAGPPGWRLPELRCVWLETPGDTWGQQDTGQDGAQQVPGSGAIPNSQLEDELFSSHSLSLLAPGILVRAQRGPWAVSPPRPRQGWNCLRTFGKHG